MRRVGRFIEEVFNELGASAIRDEVTGEGEGSAGRGITGAKALTAGLLPDLSSKDETAFAAIKGRLRQWLLSNQELEAEDVQDEITGFERFLRAAHQRDPVRSNLFRVYITSQPTVIDDPARDQQLLMLAYVYDAPNDDERWNRMVGFVPEIPPLTQLGSWLKSKVPSRNAAMQKLRNGWRRTLEAAERAKDAAVEYVDEHVAPAVHRATNQAVDRMNRAGDWAEQRGGL
ncbi:MAG: hypothetical protein HY462_00960 [Parcubacteria group bacterium]|nr:hypothetical protein [Parcubacteria group bacterium]